MRYDFAVIGGGIAGASLAAELAPHASVVLLEAEDVPGYHSTGRSAAFWHETLGGPVVQPLTTASLETLADGGFLTPRVSLNVAEAGNEPLLDALEARFAGTGVRLERVDAAGVRVFVPRAKPTLVGGVVEVDCADIDVGGLHGSYVAALKKAGATLETNFRVERSAHDGALWTISAHDRSVSAHTIVNAAGAWADPVAALAGAKPLGITPLRRTIVQVRIDGDDVPADLPLTIDIAGTFYFRPEGSNRLWLCPHDETPVEPGDAAPEELDVAIAIDRFETVTDWRVVAVERKWAGLRSFAPDRLPVYGMDRDVPNFFWCAGQGGYGIQTAPAAARLAASALLAQPPHPTVAHIDLQPFAPTRFS
ncbi:MAG: NAD(P)/FAD-dependent oxidoreductase [Sphingomonadaceae bacterium]